MVSLFVGLQDSVKEVTDLLAGLTRREACSRDQAEKTLTSGPLKYGRGKTGESLIIKKVREGQERTGQKEKKGGRERKGNAIIRNSKKRMLVFQRIKVGKKEEGSVARLPVLQRVRGEKRKRGK